MYLNGVLDASRATKASDTVLARLPKGGYHSFRCSLSRQCVSRGGPSEVVFSVKKNEEFLKWFLRISLSSGCLFQKETVMKN